MQILIDIPNEEVPNNQEIIDINLHFIAGEVCECSYPYIVLPKGHGRLIEDTPELERELFTYTRYTGIDEAPYESAVKVIDEAPTIIAACTLADTDTETWNGYHGQITAPKGTFKRIYAEADADEGDV